VSALWRVQERPEGIMSRALRRAAEYTRLLREAEKIRTSLIDGVSKKKKKLSEAAALLSSASKDKAIDGATHDALSADLKQAQQWWNEADSILPFTGSLFVRLFLGSVNVRVLHTSDKQKLKEEYNKFKERTNLSESRTSGQSQVYL
jgi:hypothetical protein